MHSVEFKQKLCPYHRFPLRVNERKIKLEEHVSLDHLVELLPTKDKYFAILSYLLKYAYPLSSGAYRFCEGVVDARLGRRLMPIAWRSQIVPKSQASCFYLIIALSFIPLWRSQGMFHCHGTL